MPLERSSGEVLLTSDWLVGSDVLGGEPPLRAVKADMVQCRTWLSQARESNSRDGGEADLRMSGSSRSGGRNPMGLMR